MVVNLTVLHFFCPRHDGEPELSLAVLEPPARQLQAPLLDWEGPAQQMQSSCVVWQAPAQQLHAPLVDWDTLRIEESRDKEGRIEIVDDEVMYELLGFRAEDAAQKGCTTDVINDVDEHFDTTGAANDVDEDFDTTGPAIDEDEDFDTTWAANDVDEDFDTTGAANDVDEDFDTTGAAIDVDDYLPEERIVVHDPNGPSLDLGSVYPNMKEFRLAVRQFAIRAEFELHIVKTDPTRYIADCKGEGCNGERCRWHLIGHRQPDGCTVMVLTCI